MRTGRKNKCKNQQLFCFPPLKSNKHRSVSLLFPSNLTSLNPLHALTMHCMGEKMSQTTEFDTFNNSKKKKKKTSPPTTNKKKYLTFTTLSLKLLRDKRRD